MEILDHMLENYITENADHRDDNLAAMITDDASTISMNSPFSNRDVSDENLISRINAKLSHLVAIQRRGDWNFWSRNVGPLNPFSSTFSMK